MSKPGNLKQDLQFQPVPALNSKFKYRDRPQLTFEEQVYDNIECTVNVYVANPCVVPAVPSQEAQLENNRVKGDITTKTIQMLIDTGASINCMSNVLYMKIESHQSLGISKIPKVNGVGGQLIQII